MFELWDRLWDRVTGIVQNTLLNPDTLPPLIFLGLIVLIAFHRKGYRFTWPRRLLESVGVNASFYILNVFFGPLVYIMTDVVRSGYQTLGIPSVDPAFWSQVPAWVLIPFAILCFDFVNYWNHRLMHMKWLWPVHAIHHSDPEVNGATTYRIHFLEAFVMNASYIVLLSWMGFPTGVMGLGAVAIGIHNIYVHLDIDWSHGPFRLLLASPRYHRWHHADEPAAYGKNLANIFPFFDVLFGTYRVPGPCDAPLGAQGVPQNDLVKLWLFPFVEWSKQISDLFKSGKGENPDQSSALDPVFAAVASGDDPVANKKGPEVHPGL
ncbi:MAG: sterol desaturase family protein [Rhodobacteraceae bacterium]|nr:sterol desaturase family protein [Paracoccaceae bacterium]